jgi:O-methyltransferase involved in polyketide biosynthesis
VLRKDEALTGLPGTLLFTLRARAEENGRADAILSDPLAASWYARFPHADDSRQTMAALYSPVFQLGTAVRASLIDGIAKRFLETHDTAVVVELGAGFSTRFARLPAPHAIWFELDLPEAIAARRLVDVETERHRFLPLSMLDEEWVGRITAVPPENILFIAEGVLFFLHPAEIGRLFALLGAHFPGSTVALDMLTSSFSPKARAAFARHNVPMQWLPEDETALAAYGLTVRDSWVVTRQHLPRWQALGFKKESLLAAKGNVVVEAEI